MILAWLCRFKDYIAESLENLFILFELFYYLFCWEQTF